jgi:DNA polymerase V
MSKKKVESKSQPMLFASKVEAGFPSPAEQYIEKALDLNELLIRHPAATYFVRAAGESMRNAGIFSGDILVVDRALDAENGDIVIAAVDGEFTVKYLHRNGVSVWLEAANKDYSPIHLSGGQELKIFGVVTSVIHQIKSN